MAEMEAAKRRSERVTGVSNVAYDLMVVLTNKLEGVAAMEEYKLDAEAVGDQEARSLFEKVVRREREEIDEFRELLISRLQRIQQHRGASAAKDVLLGDSPRRAAWEPRSSARKPLDRDALVDEASAESFPASDPPAFATGQRHEAAKDSRG